jgi:hypothetical protein
MGKGFRPLRIIKQIDTYLINILSRKQLTALLLLVVVAMKNNGSGEFEPETIKNLADKYFSGKDLYVICQILKRFEWGKLTCCKEKHPEGPPCLTEKWRDLHIGVKFLEYRN